VKLLVIRPQPGADATAHRLRAAGHEANILPLFAIEHLAMKRVSADGYDAILLTSGNAARAAAHFLTCDHGLPVYAVGSATALALHKLSVPVAETGSQGIEALVRGAVSNGHHRLLWLAGEDHTDISHVAGASIDIEIVYRSAAVDTPDAFGGFVTESDVVILHSSRAAAHFASLCDALKLPREEITLATFSNAIAQSAGDRWASVIIADTPNDAALLKALQRHLVMPHCTIAPNAATEGTT
jgi:uroporphyrinogen-III synthase